MEKQNFLKKGHILYTWHLWGLAAGAITAVYVILTWKGHSWPQNLLFLNFIALTLHQWEEYGWPGGFPPMMNTVMYHSPRPLSFPLNVLSSFLINVVLAWGLFLGAAFVYPIEVWPGIIAISVSAGNAVAHIFVFNIRGKQWYNPGMLTSLLFYIPLTVLFFSQLIQGVSVRPVDWILGISGGILASASLFAVIHLCREETGRFDFPGE